MNHNNKKIILSLIALIAADVSPNLFVLSQAGYALLSDLAVNFLFPSIAVLLVVFIISYFWEVRDLFKQLKNGLIGGLIGIIGLEIIRETGFRMGGMPGEMPQLMGVLLMNQFATGPDALSNIAGWSYHFWNGASFGIIYSIILGKGKKWTGAFYGVLIGIGFMISPVVVALGVGRFGVDFGWGFPVTVTLAHIAFGALLGWFVFNRNESKTSIFYLIRNIVKKTTNINSKTINES